LDAQLAAQWITHAFARRWRVTRFDPIDAPIVDLADQRASGPYRRSGAPNATVASAT